MYRTAAVLFLAILSVVSATVVNPCANRPQPLFVQINDCERGPCDLPTGQVAKMNIIFRNDNFTASFSPRATAFVEGIPVPYPLFSEGCSGIQNGYCPLVPGEILDYYFEFPILDFPAISLELQFSLVAESNRFLNCFRVGIRVLPPLNQLNSLE